jgi:2,3-bisphosphoglycerate-dependent phosphoglycerate mutase
MKKYILLISIILSSFYLYAQDKTTTYYLIRHAEKDRTDATNKDPLLNDKGIERSKKWTQIFTKVKLDAIYATNYNRTKQTAKPTAENKNLKIYLYDIKNMYDTVFKNNTEGKNVLIVGHSNTTPAFVNKILDVNKYDQIEHNNNANLYIVTLTKNSKTSILLKID